MLTRFEVENYKNFKDRIVLDLKNIGGYKFNTDCINNNVISKMLIYGRNGTGKTNFGNALMDICNIRFSSIKTDIYTNADSENSISSFKYCFEFDGDYIEYCYQKDEFNFFISELLIINHHLIFDVNYIKSSISYSEYTSHYIDSLIIDRFFEYLENKEEDLEYEINTQGVRVSFLRWVDSHSTADNQSILRKLVNFIDRMNFISVGLKPSRAIDERLLRIYIKKSGDKFVEELEKFLTMMGVNLSLTLISDATDNKQLCFDYKKPIPFLENASSGTLMLYELFRKIIFMAKNQSFIFIDEFDAFYHYEMSENILKYLKMNYPNTQIIITTHNTNLMTSRLSRPDCLYILSTYGKLTPLNQATTRELREGHNLEKLYITGEFQDYE